HIYPRPAIRPPGRDRPRAGRQTAPGSGRETGPDEVHTPAPVRTGLRCRPGRANRHDLARDRPVGRRGGGIEPVDHEKIREAAQAIAGAEELTMACHVGPDGDGLGSMLAMAVAASDAGKKVWPTFGSPFELPDNFRYLPLDLLVPPDAVPEQPELFIAFDTGSPDRLAEVGSPATKASTVVVIDHHVTNEGFGDVAVVDPDVSSTAELTLAILRRIGWPITPTVATCLLTGIVTDTGRFQYSNTGPRTFLAAAQRVAAGAQPEVIGQHNYEEAPFGYLAVASAVTGRA